MKKLLAVALCITVFFCQIKALASNDSVEVFVDGSKVSFDVQPQIINGRTMVPIRAIFEAVGANVQWDSNTSTAFAFNDSYNISLKLNENYITVCQL